MIGAGVLPGPVLGFRPCSNMETGGLPSGQPYRCFWSCFFLQYASERTLVRQPDMITGMWPWQAVLPGNQKDTFGLVPRVYGTATVCCS